MDWSGWVRAIDQHAWSNSLWRDGVVITVCFSRTEIRALRPRKRWETPPDEWVEPKAVSERERRMGVAAQMFLVA